MTELAAPARVQIGGNPQNPSRSVNFRVADRVATDTYGMATRARVDRFLNEFRAWAPRQEGILAAALVGSYARGTATDESDVDLVVIASSPQTYLQNTDWTTEFGNIRYSEVEHYGRLTSVRVRYEDDLEVEFGLTDELWASVPLDEGTRAVIAGAMKVLFERRPMLSVHVSPGQR